LYEFETRPLAGLNSELQHAESSIFAASANVIIPTPPSTQTSHLSPSVSHHSPSSNHSADLGGSSFEQSPVSSPNCGEELFILPASENNSFCSPTHGSLAGSLQEESQVIQFGESYNGTATELLSESAAQVAIGESQSVIEASITKGTELPSEASNGQPSSPKSKQDTVPRNIKLPQSK